MFNFMLLVNVMVVAYSEQDIIVLKDLGIVMESRDPVAGYNCLKG